MYEYKAVPAPTRPLKRKGLKTVEDRFAATISEAMNTAASEGWEYVRADTLPCEERTGLTSRTTRFQTVLVFRRSLLPLPDVAAETQTQDSPLQLLPAPGSAPAEPPETPQPAAPPEPPQSDAPRSDAMMPTQHAAPSPPSETREDPLPPALEPISDAGPAEPPAPKRVPTFADARVDQRRVDRIAPETLTVLNSMKGAREEPEAEDTDTAPPQRPES